MRKYISVFVSLFLLSPNLSSSEIKQAGNSEGIILSWIGGHTLYRNVLGQWEGFYRDLVKINGEIGLAVLGRGEYYYVLKVDFDKLLVDCVYITDRIAQSGAGISAGVCGLNTELEEGYADLSQKYLEIFQASVYSFSTELLVQENKSQDFLLGDIGEVKVYDRYVSSRQLENAKSEKYVRTTLGCYFFKENEVFLVYTQGEKLRLSYLELVSRLDPLETRRFLESDLKVLAKNDCG